MADNNFDSTVASLFKGMDAFVSAKTVVGDAVTVNDTIILPLIPDIVDKFKGKEEKVEINPDIDEAIANVSE